MLEAARRIVDGAVPVALTDVVPAETAFVLLSFYRVPHHAIVDGFMDRLHKENTAVHVLDKGVAVQALLLCWGSGRLVRRCDGMSGGALHAGGGRGPTAVYAFDQRFPS